MSVHPIRADMLARVMSDPEAACLPSVRTPFNPNATGYRVDYRVGEPCRCPGCTHSHWHVGRVTAECAFCGTAVPIMN